MIPLCWVYLLLLNVLFQAKHTTCLQRPAKACNPVKYAQICVWRRHVRGVVIWPGLACVFDINGLGLQGSYSKLWNEALKCLTKSCRPTRNYGKNQWIILVSRDKQPKDAGAQEKTRAMKKTTAKVVNQQNGTKSTWNESSFAKVSLFSNIFKQTER